MDNKDKIQTIKQLYITFHSAYGRVPTAAELEKNGISRAWIRHHYGAKTHLDTLMEGEISITQIIAPKTTFKKSSTKRYVVTCVPNNVHINMDFLQCLEQYCKFNDAELIGMPSYYRNPTTIDEDDRLRKGYWFDDRFSGTFLSRNVKLCKNLLLAGTHRIQSTSQNPLQGLQSLHGETSVIYAHPKHRMHLVATDPLSLPKMVHTTGSVADPHYSESNIGSKSVFHHVVGALTIEIVGDNFILRQLNYDGEGFCDLNHYYMHDGVYENDSVLNINPGDIHAEVIDPVAHHLMLELCDRLKPENVCLHDVLDFMCQSHHNRHNLLQRYVLEKHGRTSVPDAVNTCVDIVSQYAEKTKNCYVIASNHNEHLDRWVNENDVRNLSWENARFYVRLLAKAMDIVELGDNHGVEGPGLFELAFRELCDGQNIKFIGRSDSLIIGGIQNAYHGDVGPNGSRGSPPSFSKLTQKVNLGHSHTSSIIDGVYSAGTMTAIRQPYMRGADNHCQSCIVTHHNGKRQILIRVGNRFTTQWD